MVLLKELSFCFLELLVQGGLTWHYNFTFFFFFFLKRERI